MSIPTVDEIQSLHKKYAPSEEAFQSVWVHCCIVRDIALQVAGERTDIDKQLLTAGALIHDIGVYRLYKEGVLDVSKNYVTHGLQGYELLRDEGIDEVICRFALRHTGVGITKQDVISGDLPLPPADYVPETPEEKIVTFADKFHSKSIPPRFNSKESYIKHLQKKFGEHKVALFNQMLTEFGEPNLQPLATRYNQPIL